jgi:hypothetical protein
MANPHYNTPVIVEQEGTTPRQWGPAWSDVADVEDLPGASQFMAGHQVVKRRYRVRVQWRPDVAPVEGMRISTADGEVLGVIQHATRGKTDPVEMLVEEVRP